MGQDVLCECPVVITLSPGIADVLVSLVTMLASRPRRPPSPRLGGDDFRPMTEAPRNGSWILARAGDGDTIVKVRWSRNVRGDTGWCVRSDSPGDPLLFGDPKMFSGFIPCPGGGR